VVSLRLSNGNEEEVVDGDHDRGRKRGNEQHLEDYETKSTCYLSMAVTPTYAVLGCLVN
jgi:hypothetical protein